MFTVSLLTANCGNNPNFLAERIYKNESEADMVITLGQEEAPKRKPYIRQSHDIIESSINNNTYQLVAHSSKQTITKAPWKKDGYPSEFNMHIYAKVNKKDKNSNNNNTTQITHMRITHDYVNRKNKGFISAIITTPQSKKKFAVAGGHIDSVHSKISILTSYNEFIYNSLLSGADECYFGGDLNPRLEKIEHVWKNPLDKDEYTGKKLAEIWQGEFIRAGKSTYSPQGVANKIIDSAHNKGSNLKIDKKRTNANRYNNEKQVETAKGSAEIDGWITSSYYSPINNEEIKKNTNFYPNKESDHLAKKTDIRIKKEKIDVNDKLKTIKGKDLFKNITINSKNEDSNTILNLMLTIQYIYNWKTILDTQIDHLNPEDLKGIEALKSMKKCIDEFKLNLEKKSNNIEDTLNIIKCVINKIKKIDFNRIPWHKSGKIPWYKRFFGKVDPMITPHNNACKFILFMKEKLSNAQTNINIMTTKKNMSDISKHLNKHQSNIRPNCFLSCQRRTPPTTINRNIYQKFNPKKNNLYKENIRSNKQNPITQKPVLNETSYSIQKS